MVYIAICLLAYGLVLLYLQVCEYRYQRRMDRMKAQIEMRSMGVCS